MLLVKDIRLPLNCEQEEAIKMALSTLKLNASCVKFADIAKVSTDARHRPPTLVYTVAIELADMGAELSYEGLAPCISILKKQPFTLQKGMNKSTHRPIVCGFGPAGIFAAYLLAKNGARPIVIERGEPIDKRVLSVESFWKTGVLNEQSNVQFGEGGAGAFSDGKLTTRINDALCSYITEIFIRHGAPKEIAIKQKPHVGTDKMRDIIKSIRKEIIAMGGDIRFNTRLDDIYINNGAVNAIKTSDGDIACEALILAVGHSARDTFAMLKLKGLYLSCKPFSVGFRAEHLQSSIDNALYHEAAGHKALPKGEYQLSTHVNERCVYTFCMCPGGVVVPSSSEEGRLVTNGMSNYARDNKNANAAVVVSVNEKDFNNDAEKAIQFQRSIEAAAFKAGGGAYRAPAQSIQGFLQGKAFIGGSVEPSYALGVNEFDLGTLFPRHLTQTLQAGLRLFGGKLNGYTSLDAVLTGVETRTSSPVRLARKDNYESSELLGLYPTGEGAGYAGGIMSAAVDGVKVAKAILEKYNFE